MFSRRHTPTGNDLKLRKFGFGLLAAIAVCLVMPASTAFAKDKKKDSRLGILKIRTTPGGFPLAIDGRSEGHTTIEYAEFMLQPGLHTVELTLPTGRRWSREINVAARRSTCVDLNYLPPVTMATSPCPFPVMLSAPPTVTEGDLITFTADVSYSGTSSLAYSWTVSPANAKIISGNGTPTITVDSTGLAGKRVSAILVVDDGSGEPVCRATAQASTMIPPPPPVRPNPPRQFDVCCSCSFDDQKARLDNLGIELQNNPTTTAYIIAYAGRASRVGQADRLLSRAKDYLVQKRAIDPARLVIVDGGYRQEDCVEIWVVPQGAMPPRATPTVAPRDARSAPDKSAARKSRR